MEKKINDAIHHIVNVLGIEEERIVPIIRENRVDFYILPKNEIEENR
jgi:hypothetical protein